jgi:ankyrin repeat protein
VARSRRDWQSQREDRPFTEHALGGQFASHAAGEVATDRQPETGAFVRTRQVRANLNERIEYRLDLVGGDTNPGIAHLDRRHPTDGTGYPAAAYATSPNVDRSVMEMLRSRGSMDLFTALALKEWATAADLLASDPSIVQPGGASAGVLPLMAKRGDVAAVKWLLEHGVNPNALWAHWDADVTPLHLAAMQNHPEVVRALVEAGADPRIRDSKHDSDALGWAEFFQRTEIIRILEARATKS